ncbi:MAG: AAA family ATPase [Patescibacteria group bacterium]
MSKKTPEIVLTGGPCAGKTTGLNYISEKLRDRGFRVFLVPEAATMIINPGVPDISDIAKNHPEKYFKVEESMLLLQRALRAEFNRLAGIFESEKRVIIFDRAEMDVKAYMPDFLFEAMLRDLKLDLYDVRDSYDGVIHLVTAANGAEKFYTLGNNKARRETLEEAGAADERTKNVWIGHSHLKIINNSAAGFEAKMKRALQSASRILGIPVPIEIERKFLLGILPDFNILELQNVQKICIEQMYLISSSNEQIRIRKRSQGDSATYYKTVKSKISPAVRYETEETISAKEYIKLRELMIPGSKIIRKYRYCFVYKDQYFEMDASIEPVRQIPLYLLEIELTEENDKLEIPPFLDVKKEVTADERYSNYALALGQI